LFQLNAVNLIINGDAEAGVGWSGSGLPEGPIPGWTVSGGLFAIRYDIGMGWPVPSDPGPTSRGQNFFSGSNNEYSSALQVIDLHEFSSSIDLGVLEYTLAGYFGGYADQNDNAVLTMSFRDTGGGILGTAMIGGVNSVDRNGLTGLQYHNVTAAVPIGTRDAMLLLETFRRDGSYSGCNFTQSYKHRGKI
jgi:hypothetical protein